MLTVSEASKKDFFRYYHARKLMKLLEKELKQHFEHDKRLWEADFCTSLLFIFITEKSLSSYDREVRKVEIRLNPLLHCIEHFQEITKSQIEELDTTCNRVTGSYFLHCDKGDDIVKVNYINKQKIANIAHTIYTTLKI